MTCVAHTETTQVTHTVFVICTKLNALWSMCFHLKAYMSVHHLFSWELQFYIHTGVLGVTCLIATCTSIIFHSQTKLRTYGTAQMQRPTRYSRVLACFTLASLHALALALRASLHSLAWPLHASLHALASALLASLHSTLPAGSLHENKLSSW